MGEFYPAVGRKNGRNAISIHNAKCGFLYVTFSYPENKVRTGKIFIPALCLKCKRSVEITPYKNKLQQRRKNIEGIQRKKVN
jgi:hypothetical protein